MKHLLIWLVAILYGSLAIASNTISLSSVSGTPQTEVEVVVSLDNSNAVSALEITIPLGEHLQYVNGSAVLASARSNGHQISAAQVAQDLRIYLYSLNLSTLQGNSGELLRFRLLLGNEPADYALTPGVVLSSAQGTSLEASVQSGQATILAPKLQILTEQIDYGHIPIRATYTKNLQLKNVGNLPLEISNIAIDDALINPAQTALTISPSSTASVTLIYAPVERGAITRELIVTSNAINGEQVATIVADPFSVNELHVGSASGIADSIVSISLTMNNMEPIVAMQCAFKLPKQLEYVANSMIINAERQNGHQALSTLRGDTLVLALFSMTNQPLHANDGEIATFQLRLNGSSGTYYLKPIDVILSNITEENMVSATSQGSVRINAPSISSNASLSFGDAPITEQATATYSIRNNGSAPLTIERATFLAEGYSVVEELPLVISNYQTKYITVAYQPSAEGNFSTSMNLYTNDPNNRLKTVALSGHVYEPNALSLTGQSNQDGTYTLSVAMENYTDIVAVQYDIHWRNDMTTSQAAFKPSDRMPGHSYSVTPLGDNGYRIILFSFSNAVINGHDGLLNQLIFTPQGEVNYCGSTISVDNIVLSNAAGSDKTSVKATSLCAAHTKWANDTATACDEYVWNGKTYTESGVYIDTIPSQAGCDSIVTLTLTINRSITNEQTEVACDSYTWTDGKTYTKSGTYYQYLQTVHGCDSTVVLHLTINNSVAIPYEVTACDSYTWSNGITYTQSGVYYDSLLTIHGCDSVEILTLTINYSDTAYFSATSCDSYVWHDETYTASGTYEYLTQTVNGCDSLEVLTLTINRSITNEQTEVACDSYTWTDGKTYTKSGTYYQYLQTVYSCDSTVVLHLTINNSVAIPYEVTACDSYTWSNGITYTQSGVYYDSLKTIHGCDSVEILTLTINRTQYTEEAITACDSYTWNGNTYTASGDYTYTTTAANGCDSIVTLHLTINETQYTEETAVACDTYTWNGETYTKSGEYTYTTTAANGCDSVVTLHLTINQTQYAEEMVVACDTYTWNGETYTKSGEYTYTTTAANGCDSVVTLHLTINQTQYAEEMVVACDTYTWNGETYTKSGEYVYTTTAANGCDSVVTLHLTINETQYAEETVIACDSYTWNGETYTKSGEYTYTTTAANGCDSIVTLHLIINNTQYAEESVVACDSYTWNGETYTESGEYTYTTTAANGCDSIVTLHMTINATKYTEETVTACDSYTWNSKTYTASGNYIYTTTAANGCDSIVTLHLTVNYTQYAEETVTACDSYLWNGETYTASGEYVYTTTAANGCDSIVTLHLTINMTQYAEETVTACDSYVWNGETYTESGEYTYTTTAANGCDSVVTLHLTINQTQYAEETVTACDSYIWNGETYTQSGEYTYTTTAANGCDSIVTLHLTINHTQYAEETVTACDSYTWNGETYTESGEYVYTTTAANGCDSVVTLHLTINYTQYAEEVVTACDSYTWNGETYTQSGEYTYTTTAANGCDSIVTLHLTINKTQYAEEMVVACDTYTWNGETYTKSGEYTYTTTAANGCDSVVTLHLTILPDAVTETEELALCPSELPYEWYGYSLTEAGFYTATEQYAAGCDSVVHELTLNIYSQTLPTSVTIPIVRTGEAIDVSVPTTEIQAHIAADTWYAPNALVAWYVLDNGDWAVLTDEPVAAGINEVVMKYAVESDCGNVESDKMVITVETTGVDNIPADKLGVYKVLRDNKIFIIRGGKAYSILGHTIEDWMPLGH